MHEVSGNIIFPPAVHLSAALRIIHTARNNKGSSLVAVARINLLNE